MKLDVILDVLLCGGVSHSVLKDRCVFMLAVKQRSSVA
jgi:hypothetical protein